MRWLAGLIWLASPLAAQVPPDLDALLQRPAGPVERADDDAVYLRDEREVEVDDDGRVDLTIRRTVQVRSELGRRHATVPLPWTGPFQNVRVVTARTVRPDGRLVDVAAQALTSLPAGAYAATFETVRRWALTFPFIEPGSVIDYEVRISDARPPEPVLFADLCYFQAVDPIRRLVYRVRVPHAARLRNQVRGSIPPPLVTRVGNHTEYRWEAQHVAPLAEEAQSPRFAALADWVMVSTTRTWREVAAAYHALAESRYVLHGPLERAVARVLEVTAGQDPVAALYRYVSVGIRYGVGPLETGASGLQPRPAYETFDLRVGDCKDQATLLITMLRHAGITAWPALVRRRVQGPLVAELPALLQFDHAVVAVPQGGRWLWLDPTYKLGPFGYTPPDLQGARALVVTNAGAELAAIPSLPADANALVRQADLSVSVAGDVEGEVTVTATGGLEQALRYRWLRRGEAGGIADLVDGLVATVPNLEIDPEQVTVSEVTDLTEPMSLRYRFASRPYVERARRMALLRPAVFERATIPTGLATAARRLPLELAAAPQRTENHVTFALPSTWRVVEWPEDLVLRTSFAELNLRYLVQSDRLEYHRVLVLQRTTLAASEVAEAREFYRRLADADRRWAVIEQR